MILLIVYNLFLYFFKDIAMKVRINPNNNNNKLFNNIKIIKVCTIPMLILK